MKNRRVISAVLLALIFAALSTGATTLKRMNLDDLTQAAQTVARVKCISNETRWDGDHIYTFTTFDVLETLKGSVSQQITVRLIGGQIGHLRLNVDGVPRFAQGEESYLFLEPTAMGVFSVTSWAQGTFRVRQDPRNQKEGVTQDTGAVSIFDPTTRQFRPGGVRNMPVNEFRQHVRSAVDRQKMGKML
jgi:hypothetical protein